MQTIPRRALGLIAVLGLALGACSATVPDASGPAGSDTVAEPGVGGGGTGNTPVRLLDMTDVSAALADTDDVEVRVELTVDGMDGTLPAMTFTTTTDAEKERFSYRSEPVDVGDGDASVSIPGYEMIGATRAGGGTDLYLRADGDDGWTRLVVDESLVGETDVFRNPGTILDSFDLTDMPGITFTEDGTGTHAGQTMTRQVATLDFLAMLDDAIPTGSGDGSDELDEMMDELLGSEGLGAFVPTGSIELLVDAESTPRRIDIELSMGGARAGTGDVAGSMRTTMTIDPAPSGGIATPTDDEVSETIEVDSHAELTDALGELAGALDWN